MHHAEAHSICCVRWGNWDSGAWAELGQGQTHGQEVQRERGQLWDEEEDQEEKEEEGCCPRHLLTSWVVGRAVQPELLLHRLPCSSGQSQGLVSLPSAGITSCPTRPAGPPSFFHLKDSRNIPCGPLLPSSPLPDLHLRAV